MHSSVVAVLALVVGCSGCVRPIERSAAPAEVKGEDAAAVAVAEVRGGYFGRDWWACARAGERRRVELPDSARLRAWTIACAARAGEDAIVLADAMLAERPGEPWALFARAAALTDDLGRGPDEAVAAARAAAGALAHPDATWLLARTLVVHGAREEATAFLARQPGRETSPELRGLELALVRDGGDVGGELAGLGEQLRALDPGFVDGWYLPAMGLLDQRRAAEAEPLILRALELSPHSPAIHALLWDAISQSSRSVADKRAAIEADVTGLLRARGDAVAALGAAAMAYDDLSPETAARLRGELLARFPDSREAEWARIEEIRRQNDAWWAAKSGGKSADAASEQALRAALDGFIARPRHPVPVLLGEAHVHRWLMVQADRAASPEALLAAAQGMAANDRQNLHLLAEAAVVLVERTQYRAEAEVIVRAGLKQVEGRAKEMLSATWAGEIRSVLLCGLGAVLQAQGRLAEARVALDEAHRLSGGRYLQTYLRLAARGG